LNIDCSQNNAVFITQTADLKQPSMGRFWGQKITFSGSLWQLDFLSAYDSFKAFFWQLFPASLYAVSGSFIAMIIRIIYEDCGVTSMI